MKKLFYFVSIALLSFATSCTDTDLENSGPNYPVGENEVSFGAGEGAFSTGEKSSKKVSTRTVYDAIGQFNEYTELLVRWTNNDTVRIYSPEAPTGYQTADYKVIPIPTATDSTKNETYGKLEKAVPSGVHWSTTDKTQNFYAFYPGGDKLGNNLKTNNKVTFNIPSVQVNGEKKSYNDDGKEAEGLKGTWKVIMPDMSKCCMVAETTADVAKQPNVQLKFTPLVTVLDVVIRGHESTPYKIVGVRVRSEKQDIVGSFTYDFSQKDPSKRITITNNTNEVHNIAYISCMTGKEPLNLEKGHNLNVKFFLLPKDIKASDLSIQVLFEGGRVISKKLHNDTANDINLISGQVIKIRTPQIQVGQVNNWMSIIDDNVYFASQLSLPGAKHAYSFTTLDVDGTVHSGGGKTGMIAENQNALVELKKDFTIDPNYNRQDSIMPFYQVMSIKNLFNSGVRAFDVKVITDGGAANIYAAGEETSTTLTTFLNDLKQLLAITPTECAVVNINFAYKRNTSQVDWLNKIQQDLNTFDATGSSLCKITSETTMGEMRGKIGIIVNYGGDKNKLPNITAPISVLLDYSTSVQNTKLNTLTFGNGKVHLQNLEQVNNTEITGSTIDGVRPTVGLCPHYILRENILKNTSLDLIQKKKDLISELITISRKTASTPTDFYMNDLSGFCVVDNNQSTGWENYTTEKWVKTFWGGYWSTIGRYNNVRDPQSHNIDLNNTNRPTNPVDGQIYFKINGGEPYKGQGGNTALFADSINNYALTQLYNTVNDARAPLGIVYMSFAGVKTLHVGNKKYNVNGVDLPSLIMANNFKFPLKKKPSTTPAQ